MINNNDDDQKAMMISGTTTTMNISNERKLGATEQLLLKVAAEKRQQQQLEQQLQNSNRSSTSTLRQEYGCTIKNDGYDTLRQMVWMIFHMTEYIFPLLGICLSMGLFLNCIGYGYYFNPQTMNLVIDTLDHIRQEQQMLLSISMTTLSL